MDNMDIMDTMDDNTRPPSILSIATCGNNNDQSVTAYRIGKHAYLPGLISRTLSID